MSCDPQTLISQAACLNCTIPRGMEDSVLISLLCNLNDKITTFQNSVYSLQTQVNNAAGQLPQTIASIYLMNQTGAIPTTNWITMPNTGNGAIYELIAAITVVTAGTGGTISLVFRYNDEAGAVVNPILAGCAVGIKGRFPATVRSYHISDGSSLSYEIADGGITGNPVFNVYIAVVRVV